MKKIKNMLHSGLSLSKYFWKRFLLWGIRSLVFGVFFIISATDTQAAPFTFTASPTKINEGESTLLRVSASSSDRGSCELSYNNANTWVLLRSFSLGGPDYTYSANLENNRTYRVFCTYQDGTTQEEILTVTVVKPLHVSLYSYPNIVGPNDPEAALTYYAQRGWWPIACRATGPNLDYSFTVDSTSTDDGKIPVSLSTTSTYSLKCTDAQGITGEDTVTFPVSTNPVITEFFANPVKLPDGGGSVNIYAYASLETSCKATDGTSEWKALGQQLSLEYSVSTKITKNTTFSLECFDGDGDSSGKKSITVYVGENAKCGNGVIDEDMGEECDDGSKNSDTCPTTCDTTCRQISYCNSTVEMIDKFSGGSNDVKQCPQGQGMATHIKPGATVTYTWEAKNAVSCSRDFHDKLDPPFVSCFPPAFEGKGAVSVPVKGSCSVTNPTGLPEGDGQGFTILCSDGAAGKDLYGGYFVGNLQGNGVSCGEKAGREVDITSFTASPTTIPFGYTGDVTFSWKSIVEPADAKVECSLGYEASSGYVKWSPITPWLSGPNNSTKLAVSRITRTVDEGLRGTKMMGLKCTPTEYSIYNNDEYDDEEILFYFQSDPNAAPMVSLAWGNPGNDADAVSVVPNKSVTVYLQTGGAERCEYTLTGASTYAKSYVPMKAGETSLQHAFTGATQITLECFNGTLSAKDTIAVTINTNTPPDDGSGGGSGGGPTDNSKCDKGTPKASCNDATEEVVGRTKDGTGVCCLARTGSETVLYTIPISNPLAFNTVDELLTSIWGFLQAIIVILSLIMIVIGSIVYMTAGGNDSKLSTGKLIITASLIGLALALAAPSFLKEIGAILGWGDVNGSPADSAKSITEILTGILNFLLSVIGIIGIIMVVIGGLMYLSAAGDEDRINTGKSIVKYSLIGITVALAALVIISQITKFFGG